MPSIVGAPKLQFFKTGTSDFLASGKLYTYKSGTMIPKATYPTLTDASNLTNANANPVILDARGEANVVTTSATRFILKDSNDNVLWTMDDIGIGDSADNDVLGFIYLQNAVNRVVITNAATGNPPTITSNGTDTNVGLDISSKGSSDLSLDGGATGTVEIASVSTGNIHLRRNATCHIDLAVTGATTLSSTTGFLPAASVAWYAGSTVPTGWIECDGTAVSRTTYATLFAIIGTTYGTGDGSTTFNLPAQARKTLVGQGGSGTGTLANSVGSTGGAETVTLDTTQIPAHTHTQKFRTGLGGVSSSVGTTLEDSDGGAGTTGSTGGGGSHNNIQPSLVLMMIMKTN